MKEARLKNKSFKTVAWRLQVFAGEVPVASSNDTFLTTKPQGCSATRGILWPKPRNRTQRPWFWALCGTGKPRRSPGRFNGRDTSVQCLAPVPDTAKNTCHGKTTCLTTLCHLLRIAIVCSTYSRIILHGQQQGLYWRVLVAFTTASCPS